MLTVPAVVLLLQALCATSLISPVVLLRPMKKTLQRKQGSLHCCLCLTSYFAVTEADWPTVGRKYDEITGAILGNAADKLKFSTVPENHIVLDSPVICCGEGMQR